MPSGMKPGLSKLLAVVAGGVLLLAAAAAYRISNRIPECGVADSVAVIDQTTVAGKPLWLVHRITGFQDKVEFIEVYAQAPAFDSCGHTQQVALSADAYDPSQGSARALTISDGKVILVYTRSPGEGVDLSKLRIPRN
jgi:hypothetical protein